MPKTIVIDPESVRAKGELKIKSIPVNAYKADIGKERKRHGDESLRRIFYDMLTIREFETMLDAIKKQGSYEGIEYEHKGPAHLSIGQESAAVGECVHLDVEDFIFGSHRSHGEILAKCYSAIAKRDETWLDEVMRSYLGGECLSVVENENEGDVKDLAEDFVLYGTLAEIFGREQGLNRGLGGSMHAFFAPFGSYPNNAIVGGSADICVGAAMFKRINRRPGIVVGNIGDASAGCGPVWEALMVAAMEQYTTLWDPEIGGAPPVIINFFNNFYGMGGQTAGETMGFDVLARLGAGVNRENLHSERVDGYNPLAVADAIERKKKLLLQGAGPVLLDTVTYRISGHSPSDASSYRTKEEIALWEHEDCVGSYANYLIENDVMTESEASEYKEQVVKKVTKALRLASSVEVSPRAPGSFVESVMYSNGNVGAFDDRKPEVLIPLEENTRVASLARKERFALDEGGTPHPKSKVFALRDGLFEAMIHRFYIDPTMVAYGEENRDWGGAFAVYRGLTESLPYHRLFNSPISEGAIVGTGIGYALSGGRAVVELMYCDFMGRAGDEIFNQAAKWQAMSAGVLRMPLVVRVSVGNKYGAQHSQDWTSLAAHIPGLKVMFPATPYDAKGMLNLALRGTDPVIFFESQRVYDVGEHFVEGGVPTGYYEVEEGMPIVRRVGSDLTICTLGATLYRALEAAERLEEKGVSVELIDLRFINPLDLEPVLTSIQKTGRLLLASDACERGSYLHTIASRVASIGFDSLDAPVTIVGARNWIVPSAEMEDEYFPQAEWILDAIHEEILPIPDYEVSSVRPDRLRRSREGV